MKTTQEIAAAKQTAHRLNTDERFEGWRVWASDGGALYATRHGRVLRDHEHDAGLASTISGDNEAALVEQLEQQRELESKVWAQ